MLLPAGPRGSSGEAGRAPAKNGGVSAKELWNVAETWTDGEITMNARTFFLCTVVLGLGWPAFVHAQQFDSVVGDRGVPTFGTITEITRAQITVETNQGKKLFPVNEAQKVTFKDEPRELRNARDGILRGQLENARSDLEKISPDGIARKEILQDIEFYKAYCDGRLALTGGGDKAAAVRALRTFVEKPENSESFHYYAAVELLGDLAVALASFDNGIKYYNLLGEAPWPDAKMKGAVLEGNAMVANAMYAEALAKFDGVLAASQDDARAREQKLLATLGRAVCLAGTGKADEGIALATKIIDENNSQEKPVLFAKAYNALGTCFLKAEKRQDALLAFLHVDLLFNQDPDAHAESLYHLSSLWKDMNKSERVLKARSLLESRYSGSPWANKKQGK
jgi:tetratricopeptide (TPR) repeat protein